MWQPNCVQTLFFYSREQERLGRCVGGLTSVPGMVFPMGHMNGADIGTHSKQTVQGLLTDRSG